ncbi:hypothetical protein [Acetobacter cibinongensis]|uniref:Uncharacterized protein n=1 Tax=Acetobacter cibinongensis TaxID=146475 RepID=A0A1Z5YW11_9PROT|nr:hypothetical protein [Acetobacter cibinongensis]OUJ03175.1 hypothetical protein HK14_03145 [Acetobacter cibinongensis]
MTPKQANKPQRYAFSVDENKAIESIVRRVVNSAPNQETCARNKVFDLTTQLLRACHASIVKLDLAAMADSKTPMELILEDLGTLRRHLNTRTGNLPYGNRLHFTTNVAYKKPAQQVAA